MKAPRWTHSLKSRIVVSYSLILIIGGVSTSAIGIHVTGRALLQQGREHVVNDLSASRSLYVDRLKEMRDSVELLASSGWLHAALEAKQPVAATVYLNVSREEHRLDFLSVTDSAGKVIIRTSGRRTTGDVIAGIAPMERALKGRSAASTEIIPHEVLRTEDPALAERAAIKLVDDSQARSTDCQTLQAGMVLVAAAPATNQFGQIIAVVYAGQLLGHPNTDLDAVEDHWVVGKINAILSPGLQDQSRQRGTATILQDDVRITTTVMTTDGRRAIGTRVSEEVYDAVIGQGTPWVGRAFEIDDWYITAYESITNLDGERIGMLCVGLLERPYTAVRDRVTLIFAGIALFCFLLIVVVTYFLTRSLVRPLEEMVSVSQNIAAGDLSRRVHVTDQSELGLLSSSFNDMLDRISEMKSQLEQWTKTLEHQVEQRTQQLAKVQAQAARQQRLASVGQLAAGVAHEVNNPLGGILTFASLVLEQLPEDSPYRPDMEEIVQQAVRCRKIVAGLLEFSRQSEAHMAPVDINEIVSRTLGLLVKQVRFQDINVTRKFDSDMPVAVLDELQMQQVFMNIILNAADAMKGRGDLTIETGHDDDSEQIFVRVTDTGCGIPQDIREAIFDPFFTTKAPGEGTGLGLAVACRIVQAHGGRTDVESEVGKGTSFTIFLPIGVKTSDGSDQPGRVG